MSNLQPLGHRVLIDPDFESGTIKDGALKDFVLDVPGSTFERDKYATQIGRIAAIGPQAWLAFGENNNGKPWAEVGELVYFAKYAHKVVKDGDKEYFIINDEDCQCRIKEDTPDFIEE